MKYILFIILLLTTSFVISYVARGKTPQQHGASKKHLTDQPNGLPHHEMLQHFVQGIRITPAQGEQLPSQHMISAYEAEIGWNFPEQYKEFQLKYGATFFQVDENIWPEAETGDVMPFWATNYGFIIYGFANECPDWLDIQRKRKQFEEHFPNLPFFMPVHRLVAGDRTYVGFDRDGTLVTALQYENRLEPVGMDFDAFVVSELEALKTRMNARKEYNATGEWPILAK